MQYYSFFLFIKIAELLAKKQEKNALKSIKNCFFH